MYVLVPSPGVIPLPGEAKFLTGGNQMYCTSGGFGTIVNPLFWSFLPLWQQPSWYQNGQYV